MTMKIIGLERVIKEDVVAVIEVRGFSVKNVAFQFILNALTIFHLGWRVGKCAAYSSSNNFKICFMQVFILPLV